jgi:hypothetical protein
MWCIADSDEAGQAFQYEAGHPSKENAKHVLRSMKENARQGFWNGATAPLGYRVIEAEKRGSKIKPAVSCDPEAHVRVVEI